MTHNQNVETRKSTRRETDRRLANRKKGQLTDKEQTISKLSAREKAALLNVISRMRGDIAPSVRFDHGKIVVDHPDRRLGQLFLMEALKTGNYQFCYGLLKQITSASASQSALDANFMLSVITSPNSSDQIETMLKAQMATLHVTAMHCLAQVTRAETTPQLECAERAANKLLRTFAILGDALMRHQSLAGAAVNVGTVKANERGADVEGPRSHPRRPPASNSVQYETAPRNGAAVIPTDAHNASSAQHRTDAH